MVSVAGLCAVCLKVMARLLIVGNMDNVRGDIQGNGQLYLTFAESMQRIEPMTLLIRLA